MPEQLELCHTSTPASGLWQLGPTPRNARPALSGVECFSLTWSDCIKASVLFDVMDGVGVGLVSGAPSHVAVQRSFWFGRVLGKGI